MLKRVLFILAAALFTAHLSHAQQACPRIVASAIELASQACAATGRNQACFGNISLTAVAQDDTEGFRFEQIGDIESVTDIASLTLTPLNEQTNSWGVVLMRLQANLPEAMPGQNVTFILFGDASIAPNPAHDGTPLQAFFLRTGIGDAPCAEAPASGLIVQTPEGAGEVRFNVNGVDVNMGSTILFRSLPGEEMNVSALEGAAVMAFDGTLYPVVAGTWSRLLIDEDSNAGRPTLPTAYVGEVLEALPLALLERRIEPRQPLTDDELFNLYVRLQNGLPPCGDEAGLLPDCDDLPGYSAGLDGRARWAAQDDWEEPLPFRVNIDGELVDVVAEGDALVLRLDDGTTCALRARGATPHPRCDDLLDSDHLDDVTDLLQQQGRFDDFDDSADSPDEGRNDVEEPAEAIEPPAVPQEVAPPPAQETSGDDQGSDVQGDDDSGGDDGSDDE